MGVPKSSPLPLGLPPSISFLRQPPFHFPHGRANCGRKLLHNYARDRVLGLKTSILCTHTPLQTCGIRRQAPQVALYGHLPKTRENCFIAGLMHGGCETQRESWTYAVGYRVATIQPPNREEHTFNTWHLLLFSGQS